MIELHINGVDQSTFVISESVQWEQNLNNDVDSLNFSVQKFGSRTLEPSQGDDIALYDNGVKVFGGTILVVNRTYRGPDNTVFSVTAKDYSHGMDRRLVAERYYSIPAINIICDLLNKYINKTTRIEIATFDPTEIWTGGTVDTDHYRTEAQARKLTSSGALVSMSRTIYLDLTQNGIGNSDYIDVDVYVDNYANLSTATLKLGNTALTNYFSKNITSQITKNGWNQVHILRSTFSSTGSPSWAAINFIQIEVTAVAATTVNVTFDNMQAIKADAYTRNAANDADQIVQFLSFNYEYPSKCIQQIADLFQWQWYVDENKDIHLFAQFAETAPYNLDDTSGNYVFASLEVNGTTDQLRNSIFVRGGFYLDTAITDDLGHQVDGLNKIFKLGYQYALPGMVLTLNGVEKAVGLDGTQNYHNNEGVTQLNNGGALLNVGDASGNSKQSLQIISVTKGRREKIKLRLKKVGTPVDNLQIQVFADNGSNQPSTTNLSTVATIAGGSISTSLAEYTISLTETSTNTLLIDEDVKYHIVVSRSGANNGSNYYQIDVTNKVYEGFCYSGTAVPAWTANAYSWYFIEVLSFDVLYNQKQKIITFETAPTNGYTLTILAQPYKRVFVQQKENTSIAEFGEYQFKVEDPSILTKEGGRQRALQEILSWSQEVTEASFVTYQPGLRVGQTINISSVLRGLNTNYLIKSISARPRTAESFEYQVQLVTTKTLGILYFLQQQLLNQDKQVEFDDNEILDRLEGYNETLTFAEGETEATLFTGHVWSNDAGTTPNKLVWQGADNTMIWI